MPFTETNKLRLGLPKGSLQDLTLSLFAKAGFNFSVNGRSYYPRCDDEEIKAVLLRAQEIPRYVADGVLDAGITGWDWVVENGVENEVIEISDLLYAKTSLRPVRWVLCVHENSNFKTVKDLEGKTIATEVVNITKNYLASNGVNARVEFSWGATEVKVPYLVDAIVEVTETGTSLRDNNLRIIDEIMKSTTKFIANKAVFRDAWKSKKIEDISILLKGAISSLGKVILRCQINTEKLDEAKEIIKKVSIKEPYVIEAGLGCVVIDAIVPEKKVREISPELKRLGALSLAEMAINKLID